MRTYKLMHSVQVGFIILFIAAAVVVVAQFLSEEKESIKVGAPAPTFSLMTLNDGWKDLKDYRGTVVLLNFWASWCNPCVNELPLLNEAYKILNRNGTPFQLVAVNIGEKKDTVRQFAERYDLAFPILLDDSSAIKKQYQVISMPLTLLIDPSGVIVEAHEGEFTDIADIIQLVQSVKPNE